MVHGQSKLEAIGKTQNLEFLPYDGRNHTTPQRLAGCLRLHHVSVHKAAGASHAATAAADHPEDPQGMRFVPQGFTVAVPTEFSVVLHIANSSILSFPRFVIHSAFNLSMTVAS